MKLINNTNVFIICGIMVAAISAFFLIVAITPLFIAAYIFAVLGIAALGFGSGFLVRDGKTYPWFAAFPMAIWSYLTTQIVFSTGALIAQNIYGFSIPTLLFCVIHGLLMAGTAIVLVGLGAGKTYINATDADVREKTTSLKMIVADLEAAMDNMPSMRDEIKAVADALRYSDPMSNFAMAKYDNAIGEGVVLIEQAVAKGEEHDIPALCASLLRQIKDRNNRVKAMK